MIRQAKAEDADWIANIWNDVIANTQITFTTIPRTNGDIMQMIAERVVLVLPDQRGFATYGPFRGGPGYGATVEHTILLTRNAQGQGQGAALLTALEARARTEGHHVMVAGISGANEAAIGFHRAMGFVQVAHMPQVGRKGGDWLDLILMQKRLDATVSANVTGNDTV